MWPWTVARNVFGQDVHQIAYPGVAKARAIVGLTVVLIVHLDAGSLGRAVADWEAELTPTILIGIGVVALIGVGVFVAAESAHARRVLLDRARPTLVSFGVAALVGLGVLVLAVGGEGLSSALERGPWFVQVVVVVAGLWIAFFLPFAVWHVSRHWMRIALVHPMLLPIVAAVMVTVATLPDIDGDTVGLPPGTAVVVGLSGWLSTLALCGAEYRALWRRGWRLSEIRTGGVRR